MRKLGFNLALVYLFFRFSFLHEIISYKLHVNVYMFPLLGIPVLLITLLSGGWRRTFIERPARYWIAFAGWIAVSTLFSTWRGESVQILFNYVQVSFLMLTVVAGLALTLQECRKMMGAVALAATFNVISGTYMIDLARGEADFQGSMGNSNDWAAHLFFVLPFLLYVVLEYRSKLPRVVAGVAAMYGVYLGATTGSRGALIAGAFVFVFIVIRAKGGLRFAMLIVLPTVLLLTSALLPDSITSRYATLFDTPRSADVSGEAEQSKDTRLYLFRTSVDITVHNPIVGVGIGQFGNIEGKNAKSVGKRGTWQVTHNAYTQVSSETGLPGFLLFLTIIISTFRMLRRVQRRSDGNPALHAVSSAAFCLTVSLVGFCAAIIFLSLAFSMYLPVLTGFVIVLDRATRSPVAMRPMTPVWQQKSMAI